MKTRLDFQQSNREEFCLTTLKAMFLLLPLVRKVRVHNKGVTNYEVFLGLSG